MKYAIYLSFLLTLSPTAWSMEEPDQALTPTTIGGLTLNPQTQAFEGDFVNQVAHYAGELGVIFGCKKQNLIKNLENTQKKYNALSTILGTDQTKLFWLQSKMTFLEKRIKRYEKLQDAFNSLPYLWNNVLLNILRTPEFLHYGQHTNYSDARYIRDYKKLDSKEHYIVSYQDLKSKPEHPFFEHIDFDKVKFSPESNKKWQKAMFYLENKSSYLKELEEMLDPTLPNAYQTTKTVIKMVNKVLPADIVKQLGGKYSLKTLTANALDVERKQKHKTNEIIVSFYKELLTTLKIFKRDVENLYRVAQGVEPIKEIASDDESDSDFSW